MNKILFKLIEGKGKFFLNGDLKNGEIVNPEVLNIDYEEMQESGHSLKDGDTFDLPEGMGFEEQHQYYCFGWSDCNEKEFHEWNASGQSDTRKVIRLLPEKPVQKEESHIDLWKEGEEFYNKSYSGTEISEFLKPYIINSYIAGKRSVTIKRKDS